MIWKIQQAISRRCHPDRQNSSRFHPGNRAEVFTWQNFQPAYRDPGWKNQDLVNRASLPSHYGHIKNFTKDLEAMRDFRQPGGLIW